MCTNTIYMCSNNTHIGLKNICSNNVYFFVQVLYIYVQITKYMCSKFTHIG